MSIKAGRVGVNPSQVDPVDGSILSSATSGYTKQEADAKFLSQTAAASTYESKSDASTAHNALQPKTLSIPLEMLDGTKLTVETALQGLNSGKGNFLDIVTGSVSSIVENAVVEGDINFILKYGRVVWLTLYLQNVTASAWTKLGVIPTGFRPPHVFTDMAWSNNNAGMAGVEINANGEIASPSPLSDNKIRISCTWVI